MQSYGHRRVTSTSLKGSPMVHLKRSLSCIFSAFEEEQQDHHFNEASPCECGTDENTLREKYPIMTNLWLLKLRRPGREIYKDLDRLTSVDVLTLEKKDLNLHFSWCDDGPSACTLGSSSARRCSHFARKPGSVLRPRCGAP